jgi:hypothetical protein
MNFYEAKILRPSQFHIHIFHVISSIAHITHAGFNQNKILQILVTVIQYPPAQHPLHARYYSVVDEPQLS